LDHFFENQTKRQKPKPNKGRNEFSRIFALPIEVPWSTRDLRKCQEKVKMPTRRVGISLFKFVGPFCWFAFPMIHVGKNIMGKMEKKN
jgi:hypothetical protein